MSGVEAEVLRELAAVLGRPAENLALAFAAGEMVMRWTVPPYDLDGEDE